MRVLGLEIKRCSSKKKVMLYTYPTCFPARARSAFWPSSEKGMPPIPGDLPPSEGGGMLLLCGVWFSLLIIVGNNVQFDEERFNEEGI